MAEIITFVRGGPKVWKQAKLDHIPNLASYETRASNWAGLGQNGSNPQFQAAYQQTQGVQPRGWQQAV